MLRGGFACSSARGHRSLGAPRSVHAPLRGKTCIDALWAELGVPAAPHQVIEPTLAAMRAAWGTLDTGEGVVFSGDNREGFNGGASYVRWVRSEADLVDAQGFFVAGCDRVRAMPFLSGLPCSVHAFVAADQIAVFRPCEMLVFRRPSQSTFQYASVATFWEPGPDVTNAMRTLARTVAVGLRERFGYRGVFTIDGVLTPQGFLPTELNPRIGAGIALLFSGLDIPMELLHFAAIEGLELDWKLPELEGLVLANPRRVGRAGILVHNEVPPRKTGFDEVDGAFVETDREEPMFAVELGPAPGAAGFLRVVARSFPVGPAFGPVVVRLLRHLDAVWGLGIGPLEAGR